MVAPGAPLTLTNGQTFATPGLWALQFGGGLRPVNGRANQLFFTAGPGPSPAQIFSQGVFGVISPATSEVTVEKSARALNPNGLTLAICSRPISAQRCGPGAAEDGLSRRVGPEPFHGCWFTSGYPGEKV